MTGKPQICTHEGCEQRPVARRLCRAHYQAAWKAGTLGAHEKLPPRLRNRTVCPTEHKHDGSLVCYVTPVRNVIWGRQDPGPRKGEIPKRIKRENAEKILAVKPDISLLAAGASIPSRGTHRRLQALVARGWSQSKLADRLGVDRGNFGVMMQRARVSVTLHRQVEALFDDLWNKQPPRTAWRDSIAYSRTIRYARERRWLPPLAWDDIDNDAEPPLQDNGDSIDEIAVELAIQGEHVRLRPAERRECVLRLHRERWSDRRIAEQIGCTDKTVFRIREELGLEAFDQSELRSRGAA